MRLTIIKDDNFVSVDGVGMNVDCSALPSDVHAVQFYGGEIEYATDIKTGQRKPNERIADASAYQPLIDAWTIKKQEADAAAAAAAAVAASTGPTSVETL